MRTLMIIHTAHGGMLFSLTYLAAFLVAAGMMINEEGYRTYWWTSTEFWSNEAAWCRRADYDFNSVQVLGMSKYYGLSVRCVMDYY